MPSQSGLFRRTGGDVLFGRRRGQDSGKGGALSFYRLDANGHAVLVKGKGYGEFRGVAASLTQRHRYFSWPAPQGVSFDGGPARRVRRKISSSDTDIAFLTQQERLLSVLMYILPFTEGFYRLLLATGKLLTRVILDIAVWADHQVALATVAQKYVEPEDLVLLTNMGEMGRQLTICIGAVMKQLSSASPSAVAFISSSSLNPIYGWSSIGAIVQTPSAWWDCTWLLYMSIVSVWAMESIRKVDTKDQSAHPQRWIRMPELVLASYCCALLLRLSFVPLQSSSALACRLYRHVAVLLTLGSTCTAASQALQISELELGKCNVRMLISIMLDQAGNIAYMNSSLLVLDWAVMLLGGSQRSPKLSHGGALLLLISTLIGIRKLGGFAVDCLSRRKHLYDPRAAQ